ncbi:Signal transduction histidine kinase [Hahella chejuensis KCTC 2396]|uniref:histidine kinase n=2 Tax=Hahella chejuensis TaxID=158327 RepID=Q2SFX4_HAHCH|nr:Signal transduction histidine kinase [Hahella chejuensis KCTC 2396]
MGTQGKSATPTCSLRQGRRSIRLEDAMSEETDNASILIVDDNQNNCDLLNRRLERKGFRCAIALSGREALRQVEKQPPDLILLDVMMPEMDGMEVLDILRRNFNSVELPVLMVTAKNAHEDIISAFAQGANDYIEKPVDFPIMLARIRHHLQHKRLDDELKRSQQQLREQNRQLGMSNQYKINFLSSMSHELRTPLNAILGYSEVLLDGMMGELNPKQLEYCKEIYDSGSYLLIIINDLLDLSKIEAGKLELEIQPTHIEILVNSVIGIIKEKASRHGIILLTDIQEDIGPAELDPLRVKQILINLLSNAIKFTDSGKQVGLKVSLHDDQELLIQVFDQGCGVSEQDLQRIFLPFEQAESSIKKKNVEGTGLGLALVHKLVLLHGGSIDVKSELGQGSSFFIRLPYRASAGGSCDMIY